jgi:hypothetical protein
MLERLILAGAVTLSLHLLWQLGGQSAPLGGVGDRYQPQSYPNLIAKGFNLKVDRRI